MEVVLPVREVGHFRIFVCRETAAAVKVAYEVLRAVAFLFQLFQNTFRLFKKSFCLLQAIIHSLLQRAVPEIRLREKEHGCSGQRKESNEEHPRQFGGTVHTVIEKIDDHQRCKGKFQRRHV